jgi:nitrite reductase (NADH) small subunit
VLARGLVGSVGEVPIVASPLHKQRFDLRSGRCLDDPAHAVGTWPVDVFDGRVSVGERRPPV